MPRTPTRPLPGFHAFTEAAATLQAAARYCPSEALAPACHAAFDAWMAVGDLRIGGHGVDAQWGAVLFTIEQASTDSTGVIGVRDVLAGYRRMGEFATRGIGPHDLRLMPDARGAPAFGPAPVFRQWGLPGRGAARRCRFAVSGQRRPGRAEARRQPGASCIFQLPI